MEKDNGAYYWQHGKIEGFQCFPLLLIVRYSLSFVMYISLKKFLFFENLCFTA